jgi:cytochrome c-type biogenesis protein CcmH
MKTKFSRKSLRIMYYVLLFITLTLAINFGQTKAAYAQAPTPSDDQVNAIAKQLYCPVCENTPLDVCPTEACRQWRALIRQMLADGKSEAEIKQYFVENYGARVLGAPPATGLNWLVYIIPPVIILAGAVFLFRALKEWTKPATASTGLGSAQNDASKAEMSKDDYVTRLEDELKKRK